MIIAVDIGGTKTLVANFEGQQIVRQTRFATVADSETFLADLLPVLRKHAGRTKPEAISLAAPGIIDHYTGSVVRCGNLPWEDFRLRKALSAHFNCPIYLENDANLAGLAEARALVPIPRLVLYVTVSTGIGTGLVVNGKLIAALSGSEAGHMVLRRPEGYLKWQSFASGKALHARTHKLAAEIRDPRVWHDIADRVADGLLALIPALQPDAIVIGGGVGSHFDNHWRHELESILSERLSSFISLPPIIQAQHTEEAVLYGCNYFAEDKLDDR
ncbi:ROK family protein [Candidatus Saccharibacteria bacterium]|nr:ROK family protein [Candidatus Saccharibacteria bacterium]